jgi:hypothetical protein
MGRPNLRVKFKLMKWAEVINNPILRELPFKIELNEYEQIVLSSISNKCGVLKAEIGIKLQRTSENGCSAINC